ncbi:transcriptional regulator [Planotetraspora silvatica]|uniref:Transcriptional regulator n=1 Tax=Planotetraspora silvatica TaxID=234614 RepID=A0A8J3UQE5_9ACTN|nr:helix-turn-helix transcriptional regulator [Planotetraspora silvatica]GII49418.1 transcriptional regulator [Planotetraspora silvatica]
MFDGNLLGEFLRARRSVTTPDQVGLPRVGRRRTPGLRRDEVAILAGVSVDYYTRLEQGREHKPSDQVLQALARALRLDADATEHLYELARGRPHKRRPTGRVDAVNPSVLRFVEGCDHVSALVVNGRLDVLARNPLANAIYEGLEHAGNLVRLAFLNPAARAFYLDWEQQSWVKVAHLRAAAGSDLQDPAMVELIEELSLASDDFRRMWARHDVRAVTATSVRFRHRDVGDLAFNTHMFTIESAPTQQILIFEAEPGTPSERALAELRRTHP